MSRLSSSEMLQYLFLASFLQICCGQAVTTIDASLPKQVELYSTVRISCDINGTLKTGISWIRSGLIYVSSCANATNCVPNSGYNVPEATTTKNVLEIVNTTLLDGGEWTCVDGTDGTQSSSRLDVMKNSSACVINSTSSLDNVEQGSQVTFMVYIKQYYCSATALFQLGNANVNLSRTPTGVDDNEGSVTVVVTRSETLDLYMVCGGAPFKQNCNVNLITDNPTSTPEGSKVTVSTTPTPGICKNLLCYLFLLLLLPFIAIIVGVVCYCRKKKKRSSHTNTNAMKPIREQNESMSPEDQVNNDKSGQIRL